MAHNHRAELLRLMGKIACIFGIPALVALFGGLSLDYFFSVERRYILAALGMSFVFSWILMWRFYRGIKAEASKEVNTIGPSTIKYDTPEVWKSKK